LATITLGKGETPVELDPPVDALVVLEAPVEPTVTVSVTVCVEEGETGSGVGGLKSDWATAAIPPTASTSPAARDNFRNLLREFTFLITGSSQQSQSSGDILPFVAFLGPMSVAIGVVFLPSSPFSFARTHSESPRR